MPTRRPVLHQRARRGAALVISLLSVVILASLSAGGYMVVRSGQQDVNSKRDESFALTAAEAAVSQARYQFRMGQLDSLAVYDSLTTPTYTYTGGATGSAKIYKKSTYMYMIKGTGVGPKGTTRSIGSLFRRELIDLHINGGLTVFGNINAGGSSSISGTNTNPAGKTCPTGAPNGPGVTTNAAGNATGNITGTPAVVVDPTITPATVGTFGGLTFEQFASLAEKQLPNNYSTVTAPSATGSVCNTSVLSNWGEPLNSTSACSNYAPMIHINGDYSPSGGRGQGVLIISGDFDATGGFTFYGPVIVGGTFRIRGGSEIYGGILALNNGNSSGTSNFIGTANLNYSSCALTQATQNNAALNRVTMLKKHAWVDLGQ